MAEDTNDKLTTTQKPGALAEQAPSFIDKSDKTGKEDITRDELRFPRLAIAQQMSQIMTPGNSEYNENCKSFDLYNDVTGEIYGKGPLQFLPFHRQVVRIEFDPDDRNKIVRRNVPANDPGLEWTEDAEGNSVPPRVTKFTEFIGFLVHPGDREPEMVAISVKESNKFQRRAAEKLTTFISMQDGPIYAFMKSVTTEPKTNDEGTFGVYVFKNAGYVQDEALYIKAKQHALALKGKSVETNRDGAPDEAPAATNSEPAGDAPVDAVDGVVEAEEPGM